MDTASLIPTRFEALMMVRNQFDSDVSMADFFGVAQATCWRWLNQTKQLPAEGGYCLLAEELPSPVPAYWLRPDCYRRPDMVDKRGAARFLGVDQRAHRARA